MSRRDYMRTYDDMLAYDSDREGEEEYDLNGMCKACFNGRHRSCKDNQCKCFREHSPVFHPRKHGKVKVVMENLAK